MQGVKVGSSGTRIFALFAMLAVAAGPAIAIDAPPVEGEGRVVVVSVANNGGGSALNAAQVLDLVNRPLPSGSVYELLGRPRRAAPFFQYQPSTRGINPRHRQILETLKHYLVLSYDRPDGLNEVVERLRRDQRFAYVEIPQRGGPSAVPNDPHFPRPPFPNPPDPNGINFQWSAQTDHLNFVQAWDRNTGWAHVGIIDGGPPVKDPLPGSGSDHLLYEVDHFDLQQVIAYRHSWDFRMSASLGPPGPLPRRKLKNFWALPLGDWGDNPHGTHVLGLVAANANNSQGIAGACWGCSVQYGVTNFREEVPLAFQSLLYAGSQVLNLSGFVSYGTGLPCSEEDYGPKSAPLCPVLALYEVWDTPVVVAAGNDLKGIADFPMEEYVAFPANDPLSIAIGGSDVRREFWDERTWCNPDPNQKGSSPGSAGEAVAV